MKYIFIFNNHIFIQPTGAAYSRMLNYAKALTTKKDVKIVFCSFQHNKNLSELTEISRSIYIVGSADIISNKWIKRRASSFFAPLKSLIYLYRINKFLKQIKGEYSILVFSMKLFNDFFLLLKFKVLNRVAIYVEKNELIHSIYSNNYCTKLSFKGIILNVNNTYKWLLAYLNDLIIKYYDGVIVISFNIEKWVKRHNRNTIRIPILTDFDEISKKVRVIPTKLKQTFTVGYMGSINRKKDGINYLIKAIIKLTQVGYNIALNIYGSGKKEEVTFLMNSLNKEGVNNIYFKGNLPYESLIGEFSKHDLLVLPRPYSKQGYYGFSTKLADYLASGIPVLATDISDNSVFIKDNINGFLISTADLIHLDKVIASIISHKDLSSIGSKGRATAREYFDYKNHSSLLFNFLQKKYESRDS